MILIYFSILLASCSYSLFNYSFKLNGLNRLLINVPKSIFELNTSTYEYSSYGLYLYKDKLIEDYKTYINEYAYKYVTEYDLSFYFYDPTDGGTCQIYNCDGVEISFKTKIMLFNYSRTMYYEIEKTNE